MAEIPAPGVLDVIPLRSDYEDIPKVSHPFYIVAKNGLYLDKELLIGKALVPQKYFPGHLKDMPKEISAGKFIFEGPPVHYSIMARTLDFFRQVYERDKSEACVILLMEPETKKWGLFIPWQDNSGVSVNSIYDPADIPPEFQIVGTIHSHCMMSAFHSGTDDMDADDFNGLHITIGHVMNSKPSFASMVVVNGTQFHYDIESVADITRLDRVKAPKGWLHFIKPRSEIAKMDFKTLTKEEVDKWAAPKWSSKSGGKIVVWNNGVRKEIDLSDYRSESIIDDDDWWYNQRPWRKNERKKQRHDKSQQKSDKPTFYGNDKMGKRYSTDAHVWVNHEWLTPTGGIIEEFAGKIFEVAMNELFDAAGKHDLYIEWEIHDLLGLSEQDLEDIKATDDDEEETIPEGFMEVMETRTDGSKAKLLVPIEDEDDDSLIGQLTSPLLLPGPGYIAEDDDDDEAAVRDAQREVLKSRGYN